jgi:inward rectifier potassium channel
MVLRFSESAVVAPYENGRGLMFRFVNAQPAELSDVQARVSLTLFENNNGKRERNFYPLALERNSVDLFTLHWTVVHPIDAASPLSGYTREAIEQTQGEILVLLSGIDEALEQSVHARTSYRADEIIWNARFRSMFLTPAAQSQVAVDISRVHDIEKL